jgi:hypothetical protein
MKHYKNYKKVLSALALMMLTGTSMAQVLTAATGPNKVYIEQVGNTNTVTLEQTGGTNNIGGVDNVVPSNTNYATITGNSNIVTMIQKGDNNLGQYNIKGNNNDYTSTVTGNNNKTKLTVGDATNASNLRNIITETVTGNDNTVIQNLIGSDIQSTLLITGNLNEVTKDLKSSFGISDITIAGSSNKLDIEQFDASGSNGHNLKKVITGDFNSIITQQQGTNDTTVDIKTIGDHNTITVRTTSASIITTPRTAVVR